MTQDITLKAACADSFYYPKDWDPSRGSLDSFQRKRGFEHHFGKYRTKNLHKGVLIIRFEMPFTVQCLRCNSYINQGTRYDADKKKVGMYFTTPLYEFAMRCRVVTGHEKSADGKIFCNQRFVIRTDPKNDTYDLTEGLRRKVEVWEAKDSETIELRDPETKRQMESDPMFRAEKTMRDKNRERSLKERLADLEELQAEREDTYSLNCALRKQNRAKRKEELEALSRPPPNFGLPMAAPSDEDAKEAAGVTFRTSFDKIQVAVRRTAARAAPLLKRQASPRSAAEIELLCKKRRLQMHAQVARTVR